LGDTAWERGASELIGASGSPLGKGKYIVIWRSTRYGWKLYRDILNSSS